ncbi:TPA: DUF2357 domain-containing protein [Pseudomonas aeruginosa]|uniref:DUF2357 domain-containing protein n=2 Tax=Pseudomonas aeruginosa TaxID=287 RepID=UPI000D399BDA|nr:DUF2357 domain-containing protein [Pseudomonas aeruginosa]EIU5493334.1 DUF2357 domain-containing protein [Pseudomonas aeruginosa]MBI7142076.1 DUF2357 domain-containing protein [Pseudomonas aeruginosa]MCD2754980.1 DUF2357 domain-containing protein [Pseudomonas aeruginosa]MDP5592114.1 DUF2357 domain-containing protein [Pseudomonas aeruginosa]MDV6941732.1 DUF2357 domain-containing protein [Pseudomonas aeruginosa]
MTKVAFRYRARRDRESLTAVAGDVLMLLENIEYVLEFPTPPSTAELGDLTEVGYEPISDTMGVLAFKNFVGATTLAGVRLHVTSSKLGNNGVADLLEQVSRLSSSLVFGWRSQAGFAAKASGEQRSPIPFHQLQLLREFILRRPPGARLQDFFEIAERNPTRRFFLERPVVQTAKARNFDARSVMDIFSHPERLVALSGHAAVKRSPLAAALCMGTSPTEHFPTHVSVPSRRLTYDTPENRFIKHLVAECLTIVYRLLDEKNLHPKMHADCREMATILESASRALFLEEVGILTSFSGPTQALAKSEGYKDLLELWIALSEHQSLPSSAREIQRFLQGKDIALLYEYWVFIKVLEAVSAASGHHTAPVVVSRNDLGERLDRGLHVQLSANIAVSFNPSYNRSSGSAYSTPLRPDVVVTLGTYRYAFDAKYRLQWLSPLEDSQDDEATFVRADIYKMHTYRDAITAMRAAFVLYPGSEFVFFERAMGRRNAPNEIVTFDGVGAIPAKPEGAEPAVLLEVMRALLKEHNLLP